MTTGRSQKSSSTVQQDGVELSRPGASCHDATTFGQAGKGRDADETARPDDANNEPETGRPDEADSEPDWGE